MRLSLTHYSPAARRVGWALLLAVSCLVVSGLRSAVGQEYTALPRVVKSEKEINDLRKQVRAVLRGSAASTDEAVLRRFYQQYISVEMTQPDVDGSLYPMWRRMIVSDIASTTTQKQAIVRGLVQSAFTKLVETNTYSPACRYNALLTLGELNDRELDRASRTLPIPSVKMRELLLKIYGDPSYSEAMKIGALVGLVRHNKLLLASGRTENDLLAAFRATMAQAEPASGETVAGLEWRKLLSIEALGDAGEASDVKLLSALLEDASTPTMLRVAALKALGRLKYKNTDDVDEGALIKAAAQLTAQLLGEQVTETKSYVENNADEIRNSARMSAVEGGGNTTPGGSATATATPAVPENPYVARVRPGVRYHLKVAESMLQAIAPVVTEPSWQSARTALLGEVTSLLKALDSTSLQPQDFLDKITPAHTRLESVVK